MPQARGSWPGGRACRQSETGSASAAHALTRRAAARPFLSAVGRQRQAHAQQVCRRAPAVVPEEEWRVGGGGLRRGRGQTRCGGTQQPGSAALHTVAASPSGSSHLTRRGSCACRAGTAARAPPARHPARHRTERFAARRRCSRGWQGTGGICDPRSRPPRCRLPPWHSWAGTWSRRPCSRARRRYPGSSAG